jgi:hypothetical protein
VAWVAPVAVRGAAEPTAPLARAAHAVDAHVLHIHCGVPHEAHTHQRMQSCRAMLSHPLFACAHTSTSILTSTEMGVDWYGTLYPAAHLCEAGHERLITK